MNTKNPTLQHFTNGRSGHPSLENTLVSNMTDLSDVGLSSFNELEMIYNMFLCSFMLDDRANTLTKLNELQRKMYQKYSKHVPLLRIVTLDHFEETEKAKAEIAKFKKGNPELYATVFDTKRKTPFVIELFPLEGRLCEKFSLLTLRLNQRSLLSGLSL